MMEALPEVPANWREQPKSAKRQLLELRVRHLKQLRAARTVLRLMSYGREYITGEHSEKILAWLDLIPELPLARSSFGVTAATADRQLTSQLVRMHRRPQR